MEYLRFPEITGVKWTWGAVVGSGHNANDDMMQLNSGEYSYCDPIGICTVVYMYTDKG